MDKYLVLYNPFADNKRGREDAEKVKEFIKDASFRFEDVTKIEDMEAFIASVPADEKLVLTGGDGTLNRFVNSIDPDRLSIDVYYCPAGSGNDFLNDVGRNEKNLPIRMNPYFKKLPVVTVKGKDYRVLNGVGYGIDGYCCEVGDKLKAESDKKINYTGIAIKGLLFYFKPVNATVIVDGKAKEFKKVWLAPTMNGRCYGGGMIPTPGQDRLAEDGLLSTLVMYGTGKLKTLIVFPSIFKGEHVKHTEMCEILRGKEITVRFDRPCALQVDGETILDVTEYTMRSGK